MFVPVLVKAIAREVFRFVGRRALGDVRGDDQANGMGGVRGIMGWYFFCELFANFGVGGGWTMYTLLRGGATYVIRCLPLGLHS